jgi:pyridoxine 5'-phosphate synthase PdxJ
MSRAAQHIAPIVRDLKDAGCRVSLFIEPDPVQIAVAEVIGAPVVELHTGRYAELWNEGGFDAAGMKLERLKRRGRRGPQTRTGASRRSRPDV